MASGTVKSSPAPSPERDPLWYKAAVIYEVNLRAFADSNADGVGDFRGLIERLDYLQDLGVTALWLLPFYPSPLRDDGYDISDYYSINPVYGDLNDFREFLRESHRRGLRVITELVINHTSDQHPWFQKSRRANPGSPWREFYVWSDTLEKYKDARIIFKDFESSNWSWDPVANAYFWHRFYTHQPDLNYDSPRVHKEVLRVLDFWLDMGVDGVRLDAIPYLYEREGTNCENLPETHEFLKKLRRHVDEKYGDRMLLAEANQWPEDAVAYFGQGKGDECHVAFHFPLMPRLFMSVRMEDRVPIIDILEQTPSIPETGQWALFLRNHDELTLEMVTDEERDYMYRVYANDPKARINLGIRRRLAPLLGNDRKRIELLNGLLLSLPGTPVLYYGDELGMGENIHLGDRNGVRTPMQWSSDKNAGFSRANPQALYLPIIYDPEYHYEAVNVEAQQANPHSLLWWMRRVLALRTRWKALGQGTIEFLHPENRKILAFIREYGEECVLVVANLSRFVQPVELDLTRFQNRVPMELFGRTRFPVITDHPYFLTLNPHSFIWFSIEPSALTQPEMETLAGGLEGLSLVTTARRWEEVTEETPARAILEGILQNYIRHRRWFGGKARHIKTVEISEAAFVNLPQGKAALTMVKVDYVDGDPEFYALPLTFAGQAHAEELWRAAPQFAIARLRIREGATEGVLYDAMGDKSFCAALLDVIGRRKTLKGRSGDFFGTVTSRFREIRDAAGSPLDPSIGKAEHSNTAVIFGDRFLLKLFRRLEPGINPDLEIGRFLTERRFANIPPVAGALEYRDRKGHLTSVAILNGFIANATDAWEYTLDTLSRYFDRVLSLSGDAASAPVPGGSPVDLLNAEPPPLVREMVGTYLESARLLGKRTAAMHQALASESDNRDFAPEPFTPHYQRSLFQSMRNLATQNLQLLRKTVKSLPDTVRPDAQRLLEQESALLKRFRVIADRRLAARRIRCHGDYHLGQVLHTGKDFVILDFEGEPARSLSERRIKRSPLRDIAGMLRSFHYAAYAALFRQADHGALTAEQFARAEPWAQYWNVWVSVTFLKAYTQALGRSELLPSGTEELKVLLDTNVLAKAIYELGYELNNRPAWLRIPIQGILQLI